MIEYKLGEVWFAEFPYEDDERNSSYRPVIVLDEKDLCVLSVKVTKHEVRNEDIYDVPIIYWKEANLKLASTARISKTILLDKDAFIIKIGDLADDDLEKVMNAYMKFRQNKDS